MVQLLKTRKIDWTDEYYNSKWLINKKLLTNGCGLTYDEYKTAYQKC